MPAPLFDNYDQYLQSHQANLQAIQSNAAANGYVWDPLKRAFVGNQSPEFAGQKSAAESGASTQAVAAANADPQTLANNAIATATKTMTEEQAKNAAANRQPYKPSDLQGIIDIATGKEAPAGLTPEQFNKGGYRALTSAEQTSRPFVESASVALQDLRDYQKKGVQTGPNLAAHTFLAQKLPLLSNHILTDDQSAFNQRLNELIQNYQSMLDGKRVPEGQRQSIANLQFPTLYDNPTRFNAKLSNVEKTIRTVAGFPDKNGGSTGGNAAVSAGPPKPMKVGGYTVEVVQ